MLAIILAGGKGTRLQPFTFSIPKPLLPIGNMPILEIILRQLSKNGYTRVALTLNHMADYFHAIIGDGSRFGVNIEYYYENEPLGTAGSVRLIKNLPQEFIVMNGDVFSNMNFEKFLLKHKSGKQGITIASKKRVVNIDYGVLECDQKNNLEQYNEKPNIDYLVSMGIYALNNELQELIPENKKFDMPDLVKECIKENIPVHCYKNDCYWQDIGRFSDYEQACKDFESNQELFIPKS